VLQDQIAMQGEPGLARKGDVEPAGGTWKTPLAKLRALLELANSGSPPRIAPTCPVGAHWSHLNAQ